MSRADDAARIAELAGPSALRLTSLGSGWPSLADVLIDDAPHPIAMFVAPITRSSRGRDAVERRFQNPGANRPIVDVPGRRSLLVALWEDDPLVDVESPVLVTADADRRTGYSTRYSVFVEISALLEAADRGWAMRTSESGEPIHCFVPSLLPVSMAVRNAGLAPPAALLQSAIASTGLMQGAASADVAVRARVAATRLARNSQFAGAVLAAYRHRCAMCSLPAPLLEAAHIVPVAARDSSDHVTNGLALCGNHHIAFDRHLIAVRPESLDILLAPDLTARAHADSSVLHFAETTHDRLNRPTSSACWPAPDRLARRLDLFAPSYRWLPEG